MYSHKEKQSSTMYNRCNRYKRYNRYNRYNVQCKLYNHEEKLSQLSLHRRVQCMPYTPHIFTKQRIYLTQLNSFFVEVFKDDQRGR